MNTQGGTWKSYIKYLVDEYWDRAGKSEKQRRDAMLTVYWKAAQHEKKIVRTAYRRRVWREMVLKKYRLRISIRMRKVDGLAPPWIQPHRRKQRGKEEKEGSSLRPCAVLA